MSILKNSINHLNTENVLISEDSFFNKQPEKNLLQIFSFLNGQKEWNACCLTCKQWKRLNEELRPLTRLVNAIKNNQLDVIREIFGREVSVHFRIKGTKFCPNVSYTPLICAQEHGLSQEVVKLLKEKDQGFSEEFLKNKSK